MGQCNDKLTQLRRIESVLELVAPPPVTGSSVK